MSSFKKRERFGRGFTLIEVLISIFVLGALVALFTTALMTANITRAARHEDIALKIASYKLEELRALGYANLPASGSFSNSLLSSLASSSASTSISDFNAKTKKAVVSVGWQEGSLGTHIISLTTLITQTGGLQ